MIVTTLAAIKAMSTIAGAPMSALRPIAVFLKKTTAAKNMHAWKHFHFHIEDFCLGGRVDGV